MRVIAGKHRGRILREFDGQAVRPTLDRVKEAIFSKLQFDISGSSCLDLFCGSGALGIEALSRGADKVVFVDKSRDSLEMTKSNLAMLGESAQTVLSDGIAFAEKTDERFDFIFLDPPYAEDLGERALGLISKRGLLNADGVVVLESNRPLKLVLDGLCVFDVKNYGKVIVTYLK